MPDTENMLALSSAGRQPDAIEAIPDVARRRSRSTDALTLRELRILERDPDEPSMRRYRDAEHAVDAYCILRTKLAGDRAFDPQQMLCGQSFDVSYRPENPYLDALGDIWALEEVFEVVNRCASPEQWRIWELCRVGEPRTWIDSVTVVRYRLTVREVALEVGASKSRIQRICAYLDGKVERGLAARGLLVHGVVRDDRQANRICASEDLRWQEFG